MSIYKIRITQIFKTTRSIEIDVEAEDENQAVEEVSSGAIDTPEFDDPRWLTGWDLQNKRGVAGLKSQRSLSLTQPSRAGNPIAVETGARWLSSPASGRCFSIIAPAIPLAGDIRSIDVGSFPMTTLETRRFAVISTAHVSETTARRLDNTPPTKWPCLGGPYGEYGWFLYAHDENAGVWPDAIPDELFDVMIWARGRGFDYILFDCDADQVEELPVFDW